MFYVTQKVYSPAGVQIDSDSIAEYDNERDALAHADRLTTEQEICPPNANENTCRWYVLGE